MLELDFGPNGRGDGFGTDSIYEFDDVFTVTNQGTQSVYVWATFDTSSFGNGSIWLYPGSDSGTELTNGDDSVVELAVGDTVHMGVHIDTTGVDLGTAQVQGTIHASATQPDSSDAPENPDDDPYAPTAPEDYVAYYPLDGDGSGTTVPDAAGSNDGTAVGGVSYGNGQVGQAATFDDSGDQHIKLGDDSSFGFTEFSISVWAKVRADAETGLRTIIARQDLDRTYNSRTFILWFDVGNAHFGATTLASRISQGNNTPTVETDGSYTDGDWHHIVMTVDGGSEMKLYVDGIEQGSQSLGGDPYTKAAPTYLGKEPGDKNRPLDGSVDDVKIFGRALSATEVDAIYSASN
jgi:hypothetical protein